MPSSWLTEDLNINNIIFSQPTVSTKSSGTRGYYSDYTVLYSDYTECAVHSYSVTYYNYYNYSDYNNYCVVHCQLKCEENQFVNHWINENFDYTSDLDIILAQQYNELITYLNKAKNYINKAVDDNNLSSDLKVNFNLEFVTMSDIYYGTNFNNINSAIQKFINGITNISTKIASQDPILKSDMITLKNIANQLKIPTQIPISYN